MKKRVLSMFMALALCLTLLPVSPAWAKEADAQTQTGTSGTVYTVDADTAVQSVENDVVVQAEGSAVADVDGTAYTDLIAAFDAAQEKPSATVKLLADVATNGLSSRTHRGTGTGAGNYIFEKGNVTFDLNGHTLTWTKYDAYRTSLLVGKNGRLTVCDGGTDGKIYNENAQAINIYAGTLIIQSGTLMSGSGKALKIDGGDVSITGGTIHSGDYFGEGVSISPDIVNNRTATLTISGGAELKGGTKGSGLYVDHVGDENPLVKLSGGTYTGGSNGIECNCTTVGTLLDEGCRYMLGGSEVTDTGVSTLGSGVTVEANPNAPVKYIDADGNEARANCTEITAETWDISQGWHVVKENVTISGLNISGEVNLILCDGATLTVTSFMNVSAGSTLNLFWQSAGSGKLTAADISVLGTVTAPAGEMKQTNDSSGTTFEKCFEHDWEYTNNGDTHTATCKLCGKDGGAVNHSYTGWTDNGDGTHTGTCACGATKTENHTLTCTPNADGLTHSTKCSVCGYAAAAENHNFNQTDEYGKKCECGAYLAAEYNGQQYATLARAIEAAKNGGMVMLQMDVGERITVNDGMNVTIDLKNNGWTTDGNIAHATLVVTGGSVTVQNGELTSGTSSNAYTAVEVEGGKLTVGENMTIQGGSMDADRQFPAIDVKGGELVLSVGAKLDGGLKVPEDKHLSDYLPEGTAFGLRSYDKATGTWTEDKALFADAYTTNAYNVPDMALVVETHKHTFAAGTTNCECGFTCAQHDWSKKNGVCTVCGSACPHNAGAAEADGVWACNTCGQTVTAMVTAPDGAITYYADGYVGNNPKSGLYFAIKAAKTGSTVAALGGEYLGGYVTGKKTLTLDVSNGKTIDGTLYVGENDKENKLIVRGSTEISYVIVDPGNTLDLTGWTGRIGSLTVLNGGEATLNGGTFAKLNVNGAEAGSLLASGYAFQYVDSGAYVEYSSTADMENVKVVKCPHSGVTPKENHTGVECKYCGANFAATLDDAPYDTIDAAVSAWLKTGGTLKLYANYTTANDTWSIGSGSHTINLNGHRMSVADNGAFKPTNNMHLTVIDGTELGQIDNILLDGSQRGSFTLESGYVGNLKMTGGAVVALKGGSVDNLDVQNCSANTNLSIQGGRLGKLNIKDWADGMHVSATGGSLGAYTLPSGKILADVLDHQYYAEGTSLDRQVDAAAQKWEQFVIKQAPHDFGSASKAAEVPINGRISFMVDSPSGNVGVYDVKWYRRTDSGAEHMVENKVADVKVGDKLDVFCVITGLDYPGGAMQWQVAVKDYTINVVPANLNGDQTVITQKPNTGNTGNPADNRLVVTPFSSNALNDVEYQFEVTYNGQPLELNKDYTIKGSSNLAKNAGTHTLTIEGKGNYTGEKSVTWTLEPYELSVENFCPAQINKAYDGTDAVTDSTNGISGLDGFMLDSNNLRNPILSAVNNYNLHTSDYQLSNMKFDSAEAGDRTFTGTMTLTSGGNFVFANGSRVMQIEYGSVSGRQFVWISSATIAAPADKALQVANNHAATYTVDLSALLPALEAPREYGAVTYGAPTVNLFSGYYTVGTAKIENGKLILPIKAVETKETGSIGSVEVKVSTTNYHDFTLTINVNATNKIVPTGEPTLSAKTLTYGQALSAIKLSGTMKDDGKTVPGMFAWVDGTVKPSAGSYEAAWKFTPTDGGTYAEADGTVSITVNKAKLTGDPIYTRITAANTTLKDAALKPNTSWPTGTIQWVDKDGKELPDTTEVKANTAYKWIFTPTGADAANYTTATGELTLYSVSTGGGGGSSSSTTTKTDTVTNPDGSVTKTETKSDGTVVETTTGKDGSTTKTETKKDGSSVTENKAADGSTGTIKTDKNGQTEANAKVSAKAVEDAKKNGEAVKAPVEVKASRNSDTAPVVKVELPRNSGETKVEIPVSNVRPGTVAVLVHPDGTEEIVKNSIPTEDGIQLTVDGNATVKIVDNSKGFIDIRNHWAEDEIDFVSARGLVNGMSDTIYAPNNSTTRAQLWTILARQADADLTGGSVWYEKAQNWAKTKGVSDGANPNAAINRAQMVTMLWRAEGQPAAGSTANFTDVPADSYYAQAVAWAIENGITAGVGGGRFDPNSTCTRAQIATFLARSMK